MWPNNWKVGENTLLWRKQEKWWRSCCYSPLSLKGLAAWCCLRVASWGWRLSWNFRWSLQHFRAWWFKYVAVSHTFCYFIMTSCAPAQLHAHKSFWQVTLPLKPQPCSPQQHFTSVLSVLYDRLIVVKLITLHFFSWCVVGFLFPYCLYPTKRWATWISLSHFSIGGDDSLENVTTLPSK